MAKDYSKLSKEELLQAIEKLESRKKYGLIWDEERTKEKFEKDAENAYPVLKEVKGRTIETDPEKPVNLLIEGDNYHALSVLQYTHHGKVDVVYADPPYNTGSNVWKYNNRYVEAEDDFRHSKWLSFISKRLKLARSLLKDDGIFLITIDDYELFTLGLLLDEVFGEKNRIGIVAIEVNPRGRTTNTFFATSHEYILYYAKNVEQAKINNLVLTEEQAANFNLRDDVSAYRLLPFRRSGGLSTPDERPNSYYPIYYRERDGYIGISEKPGSMKILPIDSSGKKRVWRQTRPSLEAAVARGDIVIKKVGSKYTVLMKDRIKEGRKPKTVWINPLFDASTHGTVMLQKIFGSRKVFDYPKSLHAVTQSLKVAIQRKDALVLDFFAGSGTTGHAVLELNKEDGGNRQFILCTNNENNIATDVCFPRIEKVIKGFKKNGNGEKITGLGGNLRYFKTAFVKKSVNRDEIKVRITNECTEMLCVREGIYDGEKENPKFRTFTQGKRMMGIYYALDRTGLTALKKEFDRFMGEKVLYCFTLDPLGLDQKEFADWKNVRLEPIPQPILDIYQEIHELGT